MINKNRFLKLFSVSMATMALTMATNSRAEDPATAADTLASAGNVADSLNISASIDHRLAIDLKQDDLAAAPIGVTRSASADSVSFSHADSAKNALAETEISSIHLVSNYNGGYEVHACSENAGKLNASIVGTDPLNADNHTRVEYALSVSGGPAVDGAVMSGVASGLLSACSSNAVSQSDSLLLDGAGIAYENSVVALDAAAAETLSDAYKLSVSWDEDVTRVADSYSDTIRVKIFGIP